MLISASNADLDFTMPLYGYKCDGAKISQEIRNIWWRQGMMDGVKAHVDCIMAFSETDFTDNLKSVDMSGACFAWRRRSDRPLSTYRREDCKAFEE